MRLLIVSNRLPLTAVVKDNGVDFRPSPGGLASGLRSYLESPAGGRRECIWVGWPGSNVDEPLREEVRRKAFEEMHALPVFLTEEDMEKFYHGFCNRTIWALFHYFPSYAVYEEEYWQHYRRVNETFCEAVLDVIRPGDVVWVHDYHLMLLPHMLREKRPDVPIGFFLHIPFPAFEVFRLLPSRWRREILEGLLGADLIGFHTHDYVQYFLRCVLRILGHEHNLGEILLKDRVVKVEAFPMGIEFTKFHEGAAAPEVESERIKQRANLGNAKAILSIDRLDYSKGIAHRLRGFENFLERYPEWHGKVVLMLVVVPSRIGVERYEQMKRQIDELVGRINGRFARFDWTPILYQYRSLSFRPLVALYTISDVILVTPLRDGMNLIAKEYVASRRDGTGVLVLSEMTGAAREMGEAILMNPNNVEEVADSLAQALRMPVEEQIRRNRILQQRLRRYDVSRWANDFIQTLQVARESQVRFEARLLGVNSRRRLLQDFRNATRRLLLLDYDGTLVPFAGKPHLAAPGPEIRSLLAEVCRLADVILVSGRDRATLQEWFGNLDLGMIAEHGVWLRSKGKEWKMLKALASDWKAHILPLFEVYADRLPGSLLEEKEFSVAFHYREADPEQASIRIKELTDNLVHLTANMDVQVLKGDRVVEMRNSGINKGSASLQFLSPEYDFTMAIGDDWTDEDLFRVMSEQAYSIKVGMSATHARFNLRNHVEVRELLEEMIRESGS